MIASDKFLPVSAVGSHLRPCQPKEAVYGELVVNLLSILESVQIAVYRLADAVLLKSGSRDEHRIL